MECPETIRALDLGKHGLLEASAGTGKTYAIEHLVLRILAEGAPGGTEVELPQILVVTFTEKATGELKEKIRARLAGRLQDESLPPAARARLKAAFLNFDRAQIFTIHGFCHRVLRNYAFENAAPFRSEPVQDRHVYSKALGEEMRSAWTGEESPALIREALEKMGFGPSDEWSRKLIALAMLCNPLRGDRLLPEPAGGLIPGLETEAVAALEALHLALGPGLASPHPLVAALQAAKFPGPRRRYVLELFQAILALSSRARLAAADAERLTAADDFRAANGKREALKTGFAWIRPEGALPELEPVIEAMDRLRIALDARERERSADAFARQREIVLSVRRRAKAEKRRQGLLSFDDMIEDLATALRRKPDGEWLKAELRRQYRYCIVDEFQDTDPLQWEIFRDVFLESPAPRPLYLVGDPKQAIYGFRGGDIHTYLAARLAYFDLSRAGKAQGLGLSVNYRSSRAMVEACNEVFRQKEWFRLGKAVPGDETWRLPPEADPLGYTLVEASGRPSQECVEAAGARAPIVIKDFRHLEVKAGAQRAVNRWVASEIRGLMENPSALRIPDGDVHRPLDWGDICVLVKTRKERRLLESEFQRSGIPFQTMKRVGVWQSEAATHFLALLEALEDPRDSGKLAKALMTRFFLARGDAPPAAPPSDAPGEFETWAALAQERRWERLMRALLYGTGLVYREALEADGERRVMDFLHIGQSLAQAALSEDLTLPALAGWLRGIRAEVPEAEEERHMHREDSEARKVLIMTMHVSKGLEFPVVFLAGLSGFRGGNYPRYHEGGRTVFHLDKKNPDAELAASQEADEEERRLFYVAMTRARFRLYIPMPLAAFYQSECPLGGFVAESILAAQKTKPQLFLHAPEGADQPSLFPASTAAEAAGAAAEEPSASPMDLSDFPPRPPVPGGTEASLDFSPRRRPVSSYSHIARTAAPEAEDLEGRKDKEEAPAPLLSGPEEESAGGPPANALPRGRELGNMLHEILEEADFAAAGNAVSPELMLAAPPLRDLILERMRAWRMAESHLVGVGAVIWNTLNARLRDTAGGGAFRLADVDERLPEMEFLFPTGPSQRPTGYLGGYIDLVFRRGGRYYLLDWKSNWLPAYGSGEVAESIRECGYDLQYQLYALALDRWLRSLIPGYRRERDFGGIYYLYLRGLKAGAEDGAFSLRPTEEEMENTFPERLRKAMGVRHPVITRMGSEPDGTGAGPRARAGEAA